MKHSCQHAAALGAGSDLASSRYNDRDSPIDEAAFETVPIDATVAVSSSSNMPMSPADLHGMWYPTVRRTLVCLSKLYRCVDVSSLTAMSDYLIHTRNV